MGFSLSRAMQGAAMGAAHAAGEIFDGMIAEERKTREADAAMRRQMQAQEQMDVRRDELTSAREASRDALKSKLETDKRSLYSKTVQDEIAALKKSGISVGGAEGQRRIAEAFVTKGYPEFANTFFDNAQKVQQSDDTKENQRLIRANTAATTAAAREGKITALEGKRYDKFEKLILSDIGNDFKVSMVNPHKDDGSTVMDNSAVPIASNYAIDLYKRGLQPEQIKVELNKLQDQLLNEHSADPKIRGAVALERGSQRMRDLLEQNKQIKTSVAGMMNPSFGAQDVSYTGVDSKRFGLPAGAQDSSLIATPTGRSAAGLPMTESPTQVGSAPRRPDIIDHVQRGANTFTGNNPNQFGPTVVPRGLLQR